MARLSIDQERLRQAREARGLSVAQASEIVGISRQSLSAYERGSQTPRAQVVEDLAKAYDVEVAFLTTPPEGMGTPVFYRSLAATTARDRAEVEAKVSLLAEVVQRVNEVVQLPAWELPQFGEMTISAVAETTFVENLANDLREDWGLGLEPVRNVVDLLEARGVVFTRLTLAKASLDAFSIFHAGRGYGVLNSDKGAAVRSRGDALHEAFHLMTHARMSELGPDFHRDRDLRQQIEAPAKAFPTAFLFPAKAFRDEVSKRSTLDDLLLLKPRWGVSVAAMVYRAKTLGVFSDDRATQMFRAITYRGWRRQEPLDDRMVAEEPRLLREAVETLVDADPMLAQRTFGPLPKDVMEQLCGLPTGFLSEALRPRPKLRLRVPKGASS